MRIPRRNIVAQTWPNDYNIMQHSEMYMKPRPNDSNISTQHIPTLLAQHLPAPAKRSQHLNATDRNIVGRNMLNAFGHPVNAACYDMLRVKIELVRMPRSNIVARTWPNDYNNKQHPQMRSTCCTQQYNVAICCVEMLRSFGRGLKQLS